MAASVILRCQNCGSDTGVGASLAVFEEDPHCGRVCTTFHCRSIPHVWQCGLSASEGDMKMQDELATLMSQHLKLDNNAKYQSQPALPPTPPHSEIQPQITYITQHYHHSAHLAAPTPPAEKTSASEELARHGIDASLLFPSQLNLFKQGKPDQQIRLIQLWSIAPPSYGNQLLAKDLVNWPQTSMQQEEDAAQSRYMRMQTQSGDYSLEQRSHAEPYIVQGYNTLAAGGDGNDDGGFNARTTEYNRAFDPAYQSGEWWKHESQPIEHQYGLVQQMRELSDRDEDMS
jgi:hypothetical protein